MSKRKKRTPAERDQENRGLCLLWKKAKPDDRPLIANTIFNLNKYCLVKYWKRWGDSWVNAQAYMHLIDCLDSYDLTQTQKTFIGYWKMRLDWKLPDNHARDVALIHPPWNPTKDERNDLKEFQTRIERPERGIEGWAGFEVNQQMGKNGRKTPKH